MRRRLVQLHLPTTIAGRLLLCVALVFETTALAVFNLKKADGAALGGALALHERL